MSLRPSTRSTLVFLNRKSYIYSINYRPINKYDGSQSMVGFVRFSHIFGDALHPIIR